MEPHYVLGVLPKKVSETLATLVVRCEKLMQSIRDSKELKVFRFVDVSCVETLIVVFDSALHLLILVSHHLNLMQSYARY